MINSIADSLMPILNFTLINLLFIHVSIINAVFSDAVQVHISS